MSKTKIGDIKFTGHELTDCVLAAHPASNEVMVQRDPKDPGAVYVIIRTHADWCCILRGVYNAKKARNVPKPGKPDVAGFSIKVGYDNMYVVVGNYNIDGDIKSPDESAHEMIDDIMLIMSTTDEARNTHDADGFIRLQRIERGFYPYGRGGDKDDPENDGSGSGSDVTIDVDNVYKSNDDIINLVNAIAMFANRANIMYGRFGSGYYYGEDEIDTSLSRVVFPQKVIAEISEAMEKRGFESKAIDRFITRVVTMVWLADDDREMIRRRLKASSRHIIRRSI